MSEEKFHIENDVYFLASEAETVLINAVGQLLPCYAPYTRASGLMPFRRLIAAIRADERRKVNDEWRGQTERACE